jgi:pimeloyl-ACP methyl ester carboxylesterase
MSMTRKPRRRVGAYAGRLLDRCIGGQKRNRASLLAATAMLSACAHAAPPAPASPPTALPLDAYSQAGTLVKIGGRNLNMRCQGNGGPTVILTAGAGEQSLTWRSLQATLAEGGRVCAWDRPGIGFSDASEQVQDVNQRTVDMERLLAGAGLRPPYILVAHSIGALETLMFSFRHPKQVAGIVLIDPSSPYQDQRIARAAPAFWEVVDSFQKAQLAGLGKCIADAKGSPVISTPECLSPSSPDYPESLQQTLGRVDQQTAGKRNMLSMLDSVMSGRDSKQLMSAWRPLGPIPLTVLTAGSPPPVPVTGAAAEQVPAMQAEWSRMHDEIAALSPRGVNRTVEGAGHYIYQDRPELVAEAIRNVRASARGENTKARQ